MAPRLDLDRLGQIKAAAPLPLVLHGGSGNTDSEIGQACQSGINKVNISSDIKHAYYVALREILADPTLREPNTVQPPAERALRQVVAHKNALFGAAGKAGLY
jgi:fructose-bisphosphate aldolase class II